MWWLNYEVHYRKLKAWMCRSIQPLIQWQPLHFCFQFNFEDCSHDLTLFILWSPKLSVLGTFEMYILHPYVLKFWFIQFFGSFYSTSWIITEIYILTWSVIHFLLFVTLLFMCSRSAIVSVQNYVMMGIACNWYCIISNELN